MSVPAMWLPLQPESKKEDMLPHTAGDAEEEWFPHMEATIDRNYGREEPNRLREEMEWLRDETSERLKPRERIQGAVGDLGLGGKIPSYPKKLSIFIFWSFKFII